MNKTRYALDMQWVDPTATRDDIARELLPEGEAVADGYLARITTTRKRVADRSTGVRSTQDWRTGYFILWQDGAGPVTLGRDEARSIFVTARAHGINEIVAHGQISLIGTDSIDFRQFGVRDLATLGTEGGHTMNIPAPIRAAETMTAEEAVALAPKLVALLNEALGAWQVEFDGPPDIELSVSGADIVDWFCGHRDRVRSTLGAFAAPPIPAAEYEGYEE